VAATSAEILVQGRLAFRAVPAEPRRCPACTGVLAPWRSVPAAERGLADVPLMRCGACGTAVTDAPPLPEAHDAGAYVSARPRGAGLALPILTAFDRRRLRILRDAVAPPATLLDVGAGRGRFVAHARAAGYDARGIEPSRRGVLAGREVYGVELEAAGIEDAQVAPASIDAATLWHVLEHVEDPQAALRTVAGWLRPGGVLLVGVPNLASAQARLGGPRWYHLDVPRHRTHFTPRGLHALLRRTGLRAEVTHHVLAEHNPFGMWQSAVNRATRRPSYLYHLLKRDADLDARDLTATLAAVPLAPLAVAAELTAGVLRRGGTIAVLARRA
jgi:SAM-dependent methyltransferase